MNRLTLLALLLVLPILAWCEPLPQIKQLTDEFNAELQKRQLDVQYLDMMAFFANRLDNSAGGKTFSDKTGNCRLSWFEWMMRHPDDSIGAADEFTRALHENAGKPDGISRIVDLAAAKLDAQILGGTLPLDIPRGDRTLGKLGAQLFRVRQEIGIALAPLTDAERNELQANLFEQSTGRGARAPNFANKEKGRRVCDLLEKIDRESLMRSAEALAGLTDPAFLDALSKISKKLTTEKDATVKSPAGNILFGGDGANEYRLDELPGVCAVIDTGGDDIYIEGTVSANRPVLIIIDLGGNDTYRGEKPGIQGGAILGASLLVDAAGNDTYTAGSLAQGACLAGIGMLVDMAGNDNYKADTRVQGSAVCGIGLLIDRAGNDDYHGALLAQGVGGPLGFGLLDDLAGDDHYYAGGKYPDGYDDTAGYNGWSQGAGVGPRGTANGGIGVLLDGGGDDLYEADYFSHGGGYWFALGFARDFGGNDRRVGSTRTAFDGSERKEARFLRYGYGFGVHYAAGYLFDDAGNDEYLGEHATVGFTWDVGITALIDLDGNDRYEASSSGVAACYNSGLMVLFDAKGDDVYSSGNAGIAAEISDYHPQDKRSYNFTFLLDLQGQDTYPKELGNGIEAERGWAGGMFIDR